MVTSGVWGRPPDIKVPQDWGIQGVDQRFLNSPNRRWVGDNPDAIHYFARIRDDRSYRIRGRTGDECYLSFTVHGRPDDGRLGFGGVEPVLADVNDRSLDIAPDGSYEIILSMEEQPAKPKCTVVRYADIARKPLNE